jgi:putative membrane protein
MLLQQCDVRVSKCPARHLIFRHVITNYIQTEHEMTHFGRKCSALILFATLAIFAAGQNTRPGSAAPDNPVRQYKKTDETDTKFLKQAAIGNMMEVELGQLAQQKAQASEVKQFGARMVKDHSAAQDQLKNVAQSQHVSLPANLDPKDQNTKDRLENISGPQFDKAYMVLMVQEHTKDVNQFQKEADSAEDQTVKQFAATTLPVLQSHLQEAHSLESSLKSGHIK